MKIRRVSAHSACLAFLLLLAPAATAQTSDLSTVYARQALSCRSRNGKIVGSLGDRTLFGAHFYEALGRQDLAGEYNRRDRIGNGMVVWGTIVGTLGYPVLMRGNGQRISSSDPKQRTVGYIGYGMMAAGLTMDVTGFFLKRDPISPGEAHRLTDDYNDALKKQLGIGLAPEPHGAEIVVGGTF